MAGVGSRGAGFGVGGGATAGDSGCGGAVDGVDGGGGQVASYARAPVDAGSLDTAQFAALPNPGMNPVANGLTDHRPCLDSHAGYVQEQQQQGGTYNKLCAAASELRKCSRTIEYVYIFF